MSLATTDTFAYPKARLARAKEHLQSIITKGKSFIEGNPYAKVIELDPNGRDKLHKLKLTKPLPEDINTLAVEAVESLRGALDQTAYATAVAAGAVYPKSAYFPIAHEPGGLDDVIKGRCKEVPPDIVTLFRAFNPHKGADPPTLWAINRLCNASKHRIVKVGMQCDGFRASGPGYIMNGAILAPKWDSKKDELIFGIVGPDGEFTYDFEFSLYISVGEVEGLEGAPAIPLLYAAAIEVETVIRATEAKAKEIGLLK